MTTLSDNRVRQGLAWAHEPVGTVPVEYALSYEEQESMCQEVLDLRTCVGLLNSEMDMLKTLLEAAQSERDHLATMVGRVERAAGL